MNSGAVRNACRILSRKAGDLFSKTMCPMIWKNQPMTWAATDTSQAFGYFRANTFAEYVIVNRKGAYMAYHNRNGIKRDIGKVAGTPATGSKRR